MTNPISRFQYKFDKDKEFTLTPHLEAVGCLIAAQIFMAKNMDARMNAKSWTKYNTNNFAHTHIG